LLRETNLDDVLQITNVFVNVSKGEVAKSGDLKKAFGTTDTNEVVSEVRAPSLVVPDTTLNP
jgi:ribosome maturation protein SDO1